MAIKGAGIMLAVLSALFRALNNFAIAKIPEVEPVYSLIYRGLMQLIVYGSIGIYYGYDFTATKGERKFIVLRAISTFTALVLCYYALYFIPFGDMNTIVMTSTIFVTPLAYFTLKERFTKWQMLSIIVVLFGVVLIMRPPAIFGNLEADATFTPQQTVIGVIMSLFASLSFSVMMIAMRKVPTTPSSVSTAWYALHSITLGMCVDFVLKYGTTVPVRIPWTVTEWIWLNVSALFSVTNQVTLVLALKLESAGIVALVRTVEIVFAFVLQALFLPQKIYWTSILGAVIAFVTIVFASINKILVTNKMSFRAWIRMVTGRATPEEAKSFISDGGRSQAQSINSGHSYAQTTDSEGPRNPTGFLDSLMSTSYLRLNSESFIVDN